MGEIIHIIIGNREAQLVSEYDYDKLIPYWSHSVSNYQYMVRNRPWYRKCKHCHEMPSTHDDKVCDYEPVWDGKIKYLKRDRLPSGLFWATYKDIEKKEKIKFIKQIRTEKVSAISTVNSRWIESEGKYSFQNDCVDELHKAISHGKGGLILNATGSGKTRIAAMLASRFSCDFLFVVDQLVLLRQARKDIKLHLGEKIGYVGEQKFKLRRFTVATRQTLFLHRYDKKFRDWFQNVQVIVIDEIHDQMNKSNFNVINIAKPLSVIGLTATLGLTKKPVRMKAFSLCGPVIYQYPLVKGMKEGVLSKGLCVQTLYDNSEDEINMFNAQDFYNQKVVRNSERNWIIASLVKRAYKLGKYTIVLVERLKHLSRLSSRLDEYKIPHKIVSGTFRGKGISVETRMQSKDKFESGKIRVILANKVFKKGIDIKRVDTIINASGRKSKEDAIQIFGRGVRTHKDKSCLLLIDIADVDKYDSTRKRKNWLYVASKSRKRAYTKSGITVKQFKWEQDGEAKNLFIRADKWLKKEVQEKSNG